MSEINISGMKVIVVLRCSTEEQVKNSLPRQLSACQSYAKSNGLEILETVELGGYSATYGEQIDELLRIIQKKAAGNAAYDAILFDAWSRFVRSETDSATLFAEASEAELLVITVKDGLMMGQGTWVKRGSATDQSEGTARDMSRNINSGVTSRMEKGFIPPSVHFIYGVDRMYFSADGVALFRVQRLSDGQKVIADPFPPFGVRRYIPKSRVRLHQRQRGSRLRGGVSQHSGSVRQHSRTLDRRQYQLTTLVEFDLHSESDFRSAQRDR